MSEFVHLHNHSDYSLLSSTATVDGLVRRAKELGMRHVALTDSGNMFGALEFYKSCREAGINPLIGCDFYLAPGSRHERGTGEGRTRNRHVVLLATNRQGYKNLIQLSSRGFTEGFYYKPRIDRALLTTYHEGLIALAGGTAGEVASQIRSNNFEEARASALWYRELFGPERFYFELVDHGVPEERTINETLVTLARELQIPIVATNNCYYIDREDAEAHDVLLCIGLNRKRGGGQQAFGTPEFFFKTQEEMQRLFSDYPEAIDNTLRIAESCSLEIDMPGPQFPNYHIPDRFASADDYLIHLSREGFKRWYGADNERANRRLDYELNTIIQMGYTGYFLIVADFVTYARDNDIPVGPGRGSGAGSLVAYCLRITDIDPLKYGLLFERFLNPERVSMPDFDIDFCYERRGKVIEYVTNTYGNDKVGQIITFGRLKAKAVIRDVARVLDVPYHESDAIAKLIPAGVGVSLKETLKRDAELRNIANRGDVYRDLIDISCKLEGLCRHASTHPAGIVIGNAELTEYVPLYRDTNSGAISTQYTMDHLEDCGLVKMDILGLKTLTLLRHTSDLIHQSDASFDIETIPESDPQTFRMLGNGASAAVFQLENPNMSNILKQAKPERIEDLIALTSLHRPGPIENIRQYIDAKRGSVPIHYPLPQLEEALRETYGVIVYQEQVMEIVRLIAGFSLGQADILRRAMGKKKLDEMNRMREQFIEGAAGNGIRREAAVRVFELLKPFAGYGFNKSHAAAYSVLAYQTAYLKSHYPRQFMAANLTNEIADPKKFSWYLEETRAMGIALLPPDISSSEKRFSVSDSGIVFGMIGIKNVGEKAVDEMIRVRSDGGMFESMEDFLERVDLKIVNHKMVESCIQIGLFDSLKRNRATLLHNLDPLIAAAAAKRELAESGQTSLFDGEEMDALTIVEQPESARAQLLAWEHDLLGCYFSGHPLDDYRTLWEKMVDLDIGDPARLAPDKRPHILIGVIGDLTTRQTRRGDTMISGSLEDFHGKIEVVAFDRARLENSDLLIDNAIVALTVTIEDRNGRKQAIIQEVTKPEGIANRLISEVHIRMEELSENNEDLYKLRATIFDHRGICPVFLHLQEQDREVVVRTSAELSLSPRQESLAEIGVLTSVAEVWTR